MPHSIVDDVMAEKAESSINQRRSSALRVIEWLTVEAEHEQYRVPEEHFRRISDAEALLDVVVISAGFNIITRVAALSN